MAYYTGHFLDSVECSSLQTKLVVTIMLTIKNQKKFCFLILKIC